MIWIFNIMENTSMQNSSGNSTLSELASTPKIVDFLQNILLLKIYAILLFVVGFVGNSITTFILSKKHNRNSSTANFLLALAVSDNVILCIVPLSDWLKGMFDIDIRNMSPVGCKIHIFMAYVSMSISSWLLVCVTIERVVSVVWPHKVKDVFTLKRTRTCIALTILTLSVFFCHFFFGLQTNHDLNITQDLVCTEMGTQYTYFRTYIFPYLDFLVIFLLPCIIILIGNAWIIYTLRKMRERRNAMTSNDGKNDNSVTKTLILTGVVFVITVSPVSIFYITSLTPIFEPWLDLFLNSLLNELAATNAGINFFLYVLSGRKFRDEVRAIFRCKRVDKLSDRGVFGSGPRTTSINHDKRNVVDMPGTSDTTPSN